MQKFFLIGALLIASLIASCGFGSDAALSSDQTERRSDGLVYEINSDTPYTGLIKDVTPNGQTQSDKTLVNGKPDGRMTRWYEIGQKRIEKNYVNGEPQSDGTVWDENGNEL